MKNNFTYKFEELDPNKYYIMYLEMKNKGLDQFSELAMQLRNTLDTKGLTKYIIAPMFDGKPVLKPVEVEKFIAPILAEMGYDLIKKDQKAVYQVKCVGQDLYLIANMKDRGLFLRDKNNELVSFKNKTEASEYCYTLNAEEAGNPHNA